MEKEIINLYFSNEKQIEKIIENKYETLRKKIKGLSEYCEMSRILDEHFFIREICIEVFNLCKFDIEENIEETSYETQIIFSFKYKLSNYKIILFYGSHDLSYIEEDLKDLIILSEKEKFCKSVKNIVLHCFQRCNVSETVKIWGNFKDRHFYYESEDFQ